MNLKEIDLRKIYRLWKRNLGVFRCFFRSTPFVSLKTYDDFTLYEYKNEVNGYLVKKVLEEYEDDYFTIVDLELDEIIDLALELNNKNNIKPILNVNLLFNIFGLIGSKKNISKLINCGLNLIDIKSNRYIMMIPYDRYKEDIDVTKMYDKLNNQYAVGEEDFPDSEFLSELGYKGVKIITRDRVKDDLMEYINSINEKTEVILVRVDK